MSDDPAINPSISLKKSIVQYIDDNRVGRGYKNRSQYVESIILADITRSRLDVFAEISSMLLLPMMFFCFFMILSVMTKGILFYFFMAISGVFAILLSIVYYRKHGGVKNYSNKHTNK